jgi:hypothetical protein
MSKFWLTLEAVALTEIVACGGVPVTAVIVAPAGIGLVPDETWSMIGCPTSAEVKCAFVEVTVFELAVVPPSVTSRKFFVVQLQV